MEEERVISIEWEDASYNDGYYNEDSRGKFRPARTKTVGFLVKEEEGYIVVSHNRFYDARGGKEDDRHISTIPRGMIKVIRELGELAVIRQAELSKVEPLHGELVEPLDPQGVAGVTWLL